MDIETDEQAWARRAAGSLRRFTGMANRGSAVGDLTEAVLAEVRSLRERVRVAEGGGGMCHFVSEILASERRWAQLSVGYLSLDGAMICASHYVNVLGDGTLLDATADQFGEGHDIRIVRPDDPEYGRYRPEFYEDYNPGIDPVALADWLPDWIGLIDFDAQDVVDGERGPAWWLDDPTPRIEFLRSQIALANGKKRGHGPTAMMEDEIEGIETGLAGSSPKA
jgi:hypothetical protein